MKSIIVTSLLIGFTFSGFAQNLEDKKVEGAEKISTDFSVPAIPALDFISSDPSDISRPSNVKKLAAGLYNGIDEQGNVKQGLAIEAKIAEYLPLRIDPSEYRNNRLKYILYNTQLSLGTIATSGDSTSTDLGWGIRLTIFDKSDPMTDKDYIEEFEDIMRQCGPQNPLDTISNENFSKCISERDRPILEKFTKEKWNASWLTLAYAGGSRLKGSQISEGKTLGHQVWLSGGLPIKHWGQLSYLAKWSEEFSEETSQNIQEFEIGGKLLVGTKSYNLFTEVSYNPLLNKADFEMNRMVMTDKVFSWLAGVEFKITEGVWAVAGLGEEAERIVGNDGIQLLTGIRMGISDKSRLKK
jgi:hypothetical protein